MTRHRFHWLMFGFLLSLAFVADAKAMYAPSIGRFLSRDPIEFEGSQWNFYEIANSRIHTGLDPSGMCEVEKCKDQEKTKDLPACPEKSRDDYLNDFYKDKKKKLGIENTKLEVKAHCKKEDLKDKDKCKPGRGRSRYRLQNRRYRCDGTKVRICKENLIFTRIIQRQTTLALEISFSLVYCR